MFLNDWNVCRTIFRSARFSEANSSSASFTSLLARPKYFCTSFILATYRLVWFELIRNCSSGNRFENDKRYWKWLEFSLNYDDPKYDFRRGFKFTFCIEQLLLKGTWKKFAKKKIRKYCSSTAQSTGHNQISRSSIFSFILINCIQKNAHAMSK